jgi:hypothetical protein
MKNVIHTSTLCLLLCKISLKNFIIFRNENNCDKPKNYDQMWAMHLKNYSDFTIESH